jgi:filamentous hemagglutinin
MVPAVSPQRRPLHAAIRRVLALAACVAPVTTAPAADLPVPCIAGVCGANVPGFVTSGGAGAAIAGNTLTVTQTTQNATLNWSSFNISADGVVNFVQPGSSATALNRIHANDPSRIFGALNANGRVYLLNRNGILFGDGARVNVGGLLASSLDITPEAIEKGLAGAAPAGAPALRLYSDETGELPSGAVTIAEGATLRTAEGGQVLIFAPEVTNEGRIETPGGQALLAAGAPVYLVTSNDPGIRGLLVEVGVGGTVTNGREGDAAADPREVVGQIIAERGNVTLAGLAVNQQGRVSATTSVRANGSIRLQARDGGGTVGGSNRLTAANGGQLTLGAGSLTEVSLVDSKDTDVDANEQARSRIELQGRDVLVRAAADVVATGGVIKATARANPGDSTAILGPADIDGGVADGARILVEAGATLDVSGASAELAMESNLVRAELRGDELADSPVQRDGALRGETVFVDRRLTGTRADGSTWQGTPLGNVAGQISLTGRTVQERNLAGGNVTLESQGDVVLAPGSRIDLSGGVVTYRDGYVNTTQLQGADGRIYDIGSADPNRGYTGIATTATVKYERWGVTREFQTFASQGRFEAGYVEGKDAGSLQLVTPSAIVDGDVVGAVTVGRYQRRAAQPVAAGALYRPYDQVPLGAQLVFGSPAFNAADLVGGDVRIGGGRVLPTLKGPGGAAFDPLLDALPEDFVTSLGDELFGAARVTRLTVNSNGLVTLPESTVLDLGGQGELTVAAGAIDVAGDVRAPSGSVSLTALLTNQSSSPYIGVDLRGSATIDLAGRWINESTLLNAAGAALPALFTAGGRFSVSARQGYARLDGGAVIDVSGGARALSSGSVVAGAAGSVTISATPNLLFPEPDLLRIDATLRGFGLANGGSLSLAGPSLCIGVADCGDAIRLRPEDLLAGGFGSISLRSTEGGLTVRSDASLVLRQSNFVLRAGALGAASGAALADLADVGQLTDDRRRGVNLSLTTAIPALPGGLLYTNDDFAALGGLVVERGAVIQGDLGSSIALRSNSSLLVDGSIFAPAGTIALTLDNSLAIGEVIDAQGIWLGSSARLDAAGAARLQPNRFGLRVGEVLDGGTVSITAQRGYVAANPGSVIDVSGGVAVLDLPDAPGASNATTPRSIASDGGRIAVTAADAALLSGDLRAASGDPASSAAGGELLLAMNANDRLGTGEPFALAFTERRVRLTDETRVVSLQQGAALPDSLFGRAIVSDDQIASAGFDSVTLAAATTVGLEFGLEVIAPSTVELAGDVDLQLGRQFVVDAARLAGTGQSGIAAPYVAIGHTNRAYQQTPVSTGDVSGSLRIDAALIEFVGNSVIDGFPSIELVSSGDIRLRGVQGPGARSVVGGLTTQADLWLRADQVYAATLSNFLIDANDPAGGRIRIEGTGGERATLLSAGSRLRLRADTIEQAGVLRAPFGSIELDARALTLTDGSLTSTSAEGSLIPFGGIQAGTEWVYGLQGQTLVVGDTTPVPEQRVRLDADEIDVAAGAVVDLSGGGDLLAYEFIPGSTGKIDVLSADVSPGLFAIVPSLELGYAPYDPQESPDTRLGVGDVVHLSGGVAGVPEGDYVLLPAAYALLPGGFVVSAAAGFQDLPAGATVQQLDGSTIVSGYRAVANTGIADTRSSGFLVRSASQVAELARYDTTRASRFLAGLDADDPAGAARLPVDAGVLSISAGTRLDLEGALRAATRGGRGAAVDISADRLLLSGADDVAAGVVRLDPAQLGALGAESLLLGGSRGTTADGVAIATEAVSVEIAGDVNLSGPQLLLVAGDQLTVAGGASLRVTGSGSGLNDRFLLEGDGAALALSAGPAVDLIRSGEQGLAGTVLLEAGSRVEAPGGSLALDASLDTRSAATLVLPGGSLSFGAGLINIGDVPEGTAGLTLDAAALSALDLRELRLVSRSGVDLYGDLDLSLERLVVDAAGWRQVAAGQDVRVAATGSIVLRNSADAALADAGLTNGALRFAAREVEFDAGVQRVAGYDDVRIEAADSVVLAGTGGLRADGDLAVIAPRVSVGRGAQTRLDSGGDLLVEGATAAAQSATAGLGGRLLLRGATVSIGTRIEAAAGTIDVESTGDLVSRDGAVLDVAGRIREFDGRAQSAAAGSVRLAATAGDLRLEAGSVVDVSAAGAGRAGTLKLYAPGGAITLGGTLQGDALAAGDSGRLFADAAVLGALDSINATLNDGGFFNARRLRQRGVGDLVVGSEPMRALDVTLAADQGSVVVSGTIDASGADGGDVLLSARDDVRVSGRIDASAALAGGDGGRVLLDAAQGGVRLTAGAVLDVGPGAGATPRQGRVDVRATRASYLTLTDGDAGNDNLELAGQIVGAGRIGLEAVAVYDDADGLVAGGVIDAANVAPDLANPLYADAVDFMAAEATILGALALDGDARAQLRPGIEIRTAGDLALGPVGDPSQPAAVNWDLSGWRFGVDQRTPGMLTLRAGGNLTFNGSLSDGFAGVTGNASSPAFRLNLTDPTESWSYRLVAGADLAAADVMSVDAASGGDVTIASGNPSATATTVSGFRMVRTGTGSIDVAASGDFILGNRASVLYTAGRAASAGATLGTGSIGLGGRAYPVDGGDIRLAVGGDIVGADALGPDNGFTTQLVTDWLWRTGKDASASPNGFPTAWTVNFARFEQNVAALGGGDVRIDAGGDIINFAASIPGIGVPSTNRAADSVLTVRGGGDLTVRAGGDIRGGSYFVGRGAGRLEAGGDIAAADNPLAQGAVFPVLALADGSWDLIARGAAGIETVVNPTLLPQGRSQGTGLANQSVFSTYAPSSRVRIEAVAGDIVVANNTPRLVDWLGRSMPLATEAQLVALQIYAPNLTAVAYSGGFAFDRTIALYPAAGSALEILVETDVTRVNPENPAVILQSDADLAALPNVAAPRDNGAALVDAFSSPTSIATLFNSPTPVHAGDTAVSRIVARTGDISFRTPEGSLAGNTSLLWFSTPTRIVAGGDIVDLPLAVQHDDAGDITTVRAGGDIRYSVARSATGSILSSSLGIDVSGPGSLQLVAGRDVDLQTSRGVTTLGNLENPALAATGADITVLAGLNGATPGYTGMIARYLDAAFGPGAGGDVVAFVAAVTGEDGLSVEEASARARQLAGYRAELVDFVEQRSKLSGLDEAAALAIFRGYEPSLQSELLDRIMVAELRFAGREAARTGSEDFTRAFTALETLYPGANPDPEQDETNRYRGDISLYFSRIYSLAGGDIALFAPGGGVNAGLASPPASFGLVKDASQLGVVIRGPGSISSVSFGDFQVNESRVFATDGGDILVWSTRGDIDAGRGAKTAISAPPPTITFDANGTPIIVFPATLSGSGIQTLATSDGVKPGNVDLFAPRGVVNAGDAGIVAGNLTIAATAVLGADNISVGGIAVGVPVDAGGLGASLAGASSVASSASSAAQMAIDSGGGDAQEDAPLADAALSWLEVFVVGLGDEGCRQDDLECLKRQRQQAQP